jgi:hypothetical protein
VAKTTAVLKRIERNPLDERIKRLLKELGDAINESISNSDEVNQRIQEIRDAGYNIYVLLDATIGLGTDGDEEESVDELKSEMPVRQSTPDIQFRINVQDLAFLRSVGIDPTRKVKTPKRLEGRSVSDAGQN